MITGNQDKHWMREIERLEEIRYYFQQIPASYINTLRCSEMEFSTWIEHTHKRV